MIKTFVFKLYRSKKNKLLHDQIEAAASVYNYCIAAHRTAYELSGNYVDKYQLQKELTRLKHTEDYASWKAIGSQVIQDITDRIDRGYKLFFQDQKKQKNPTKRTVRPPSFKKASKYKSITFKQAGYALLGGNRIRIGKTIFKYSKSREIEGLVKSLTVKRNALGELFIFFCCDVADPQISRTKTGKIAGFDFGLKTFLTSSEELSIDAPLFYREGEKLISQAHKELSRKQKESRHRHNARTNCARVHEKIANQRKDYHYKLARKLAIEYDLLCFEDLNIAAMKKLWGKKVSDLGFSAFIIILRYACSLTGAKIQLIDRFYPSSKQCHNCFALKKDLSLKDRVWECNECHLVHQRDKNAAFNILREGASSLGLGNVRPSFMAISA